jgi:hypothetical protein
LVVDITSIYEPQMHISVVAFLLEYPQG